MSIAINLKDKKLRWHGITYNCVVDAFWDCYNSDEAKLANFALQIVIFYNGY